MVGAGAAGAVVAATGAVVGFAAAVGAAAVVGAAAAVVGLAAVVGAVVGEGAAAGPHAASSNNPADTRYRGRLIGSLPMWNEGTGPGWAGSRLTRVADCLRVQTGRCRR